MRKRIPTTWSAVGRAIQLVTLLLWVTGAGLVTAASPFPPPRTSLPDEPTPVSSINNELPTPASIFGFRPGTEKKPADYHQILEYFAALDSASDRLLLQTLGSTTEGNDFVVAIISSRENLERLDDWKKIQARLADPRKIKPADLPQLLARGRAVVLINCSLHATEVGATQMSPALAYQLAAGNSPATREILDNVITLLVPCHNPDGQLMVVDWYRQHLGTQYEDAPLPWLYQKYTGHDNNRDWFMFTQKETRLTVEKLHNVWRPHITIDMHQMGRNGARLFVPPYIDPFEPNVDATIIGLLNMLGTHVQTVLTAQGKSGVVSNAIYDAWTPARAYPHYHAGLRFLTEAASVKIATPVNIPAGQLSRGTGYDARKASWNFPKPWPGGKWRLRDIVDYDFAAAMAVLEHAARNREFWLRSLYQVLARAVADNQKPTAFVIPAEQRDPQGLFDLLHTLKTGGVEVHRAGRDFMADGSPFHKGDFVVQMAQPYGKFAKALLETQHYPSLVGSDGRQRRPYDMSAHTLPLFLGVNVFAVRNLSNAGFRLVHTIQTKSEFTGGRNAGHYALDRRNTASFLAVNALLQKDIPVWTATASFEDNGNHWPAGTFIVKGNRTRRTLDDLVSSGQIIASPHEGKAGVVFTGLRHAPGVELRELKPPRVGLYKSWVANIDEGWTRWVLEDYGFEYRSLTNEDIRALDLRNSFDVLIFPDQRLASLETGHSPERMPEKYTGGIGEAGIRRLRQFVEAGGTLVALSSAADFFVKHFWLQVVNVTAEVDRSEFSAPGSVLRVLAEATHPLAFGAKREEAIFFVNSPAFRVEEGRAILTYPPRGLLLSGWLAGEKILVERAALVDIELGGGRVILFGFRPQFRAQFRATYKFLFNALLLAAQR